jgi:hypothetical protein
MARQEKHRNSQPAVPAPARGMSPAWLLPILLCLCLGLRIDIYLTAFSKGGFLSGPLTDDSFYSLGIARNLAAGAGFTFDGINLTNGFQPLYVFLMVPVYALFPHDPMTPVKIAVLLLALCNTAAGFFLWRILRREVSARAAVFGLALFAFSPYIAEVGLNGLESSLALLLFLAALDLYLARVRPGTDRRAHRLGLAALLALLVFARVDGALLAAAIAADYLLRRDPLPFRARAFKMAGIAAAAVALYSPWLIFSRLNFGTALPQSGDAVRLMAQLYGEMEMPIAVPPFIPGDIPARFYAGHLIHALMVLGMTGLFFPAGPAIFFLQLVGQASGMWGIGSWIVCIPALILGAGWAFKARKTLGAVWWAVGLTVAAYSFYVFGAWFFFRYLYVAEVCLLMAGAALYERLASRRLLPWVAAAYLVIFGYGFAIRSQPNDFQLFNYDLIKRALEAKTPAGARVGAFQAGYVGYFSAGRTVVNLDGVVNPKAYAALRDGRLYNYLASEKIEYVADYKNIVDRLLLPRLGADPAAALAPLSAPDEPVQVFKVKLIIDN